MRSVGKRYVEVTCSSAMLIAFALSKENSSILAHAAPRLLTRTLGWRRQLEKRKELSDCRNIQWLIMHYEDYVCRFSNHLSVCIFSCSVIFYATHSCDHSKLTSSAWVAWHKNTSSRLLFFPKLASLLALLYTETRGWRFLSVCSFMRHISEKARWLCTESPIKSVRLFARISAHDETEPEKAVGFIKKNKSYFLFFEDS